MSLNKAIESGKEHRKQYKYKRNYAKLVDTHCRNNGECRWCTGNRTYRNRKNKAKSEVKDE